jgi:uncharacterized protein (TIGR03435 family)
VLLLPEGIVDRLTPAQLNAVVAHEMCHVRRRDNLTFALHMLVETLFWFHPLVWWISARLVDERECACDEFVLQSGGAAEVYAEGILNVCKYYVESPLACVSGVTGSDLKKRIVRIMTEQVVRKLGFSRKLLIGVAGLIAMAMPVSFGLVHAAQSHVQSQAKDTMPQDAAQSAPMAPIITMAGDATPGFDVVTIKPSVPGEQGMKGFMFRGRQFVAINTTVNDLLALAYGIHAKQIVGTPDWTASVLFDTRGVPDVPGQPNAKQVGIMMQKLLADRFQLKLHHETRELAVYAITVASGGSKLTKSSAAPDGQSNFGLRGMGNLVASNVNMAEFASWMQSSVMDRPVVDQTGLTDKYDFTLKWTPDDSQFAQFRRAMTLIPPAAGDNPNAPPGLYTAVQMQLGLKFRATKAPDDVIVIDHIEKPSPN